MASLLPSTTSRTNRTMSASEPETTKTAEHPLENYAPAPGIFDEMQSAAGETRPPWRPLSDSLTKLTQHELAARWEHGLRIIREHGVTYNVYGDAQGSERPWALDLVPFIISAEDWAAIERGLSQRVRLLNLILADIYGGSQHLLRDGFLPPELIYANPGFLRSCRGFVPPKNSYLTFHGSDLVRSGAGQWWVLADRTQAPSGAGYALENRAVISRILPDELRAGNVRRLGSFFRTRYSLLANLVTKSKAEPRGVLLTPGPLNETYFEHAFLARHMGLPLVEGADLTVRDRRVFLKTVEGLQPVDLIIRRVDDTFCDPLELRGDSFLGVPGLVEAARAGNVVISNALGTGLLESPAVLAFLPILCRHLLGEELLIPSAATWWCGQARELRYVLDNLDQLVIKPAFGTSRRPPWFGGSLSKHEKANLIRAIKAAPQNFLGQERVVLSRAPVWHEGVFESRSMMVRAFVASDGESYHVMPGGLARVSPTTEEPVVSMQSGGGSKDIWVLANGGGAAPASEAPRELRPLVRGSNTVPSRAADNLFWLGRYTERLENTARLLRCLLSRFVDDGERERLPERAVLPHLFEALGQPLPAGLDLSSSPALREHALALVHREDLLGSVRELLRRIHGIAANVRDRFSGDIWRILGRMDRNARGGMGKLPLNNALSLIHRLVLDLAAFSGLEMENMTRGHGWRFLDLGRRLERGICMSGFLRGGVLAAGNPNATFELLLDIADSTMTYRRLYMSEVRPLEAIDLLLRDDSNPRSVAFQLHEVAEHTRALPQREAAGASPEHLLVNRVAARIQGADLTQAGRLWREGHAEPLMRLLGDCVQGLIETSENLTHHYFSHTIARLS